MFSRAAEGWLGRWSSCGGPTCAASQVPYLLVAASLAHHPDGGALHGLTTQGAQHQGVGGAGRGGSGSGRRGSSRADSDAGGTLSLQRSLHTHQVECIATHLKGSRSKNR